LVITVTDGSTVPVTAEADFLYQGETTMLIGEPPLATLAAETLVECDRPGGVAATLDGSGSVDPDAGGGIVAYEWFRDFGLPTEQPLGTGAVLVVTLPLGENRVALRVTDIDGMTDVAETVIVVVDGTPPAVTCPGTSVIECTGPSGALVSLTATANDACGVAVSIENTRTGAGGDASGVYPLGTTSVTFTATDGLGNAATCISSVTVQDTTAPVLSSSVNPPMLWPPNHRLVDIDTLVNASDVCSTTAPFLNSVTSNEPDNAEGMGDGDTVDDIQGAAAGTADFQFQLRAERAGTGQGRTYTIIYRGTDDSGNVGTATSSVFVPHDQGGVTEPMMIAAHQNGTGMVLEWDAISGALFYNAVRGKVNSLRDKLDFFHLGQLTCIASVTTQTSTMGSEDTELPSPGDAFFYLVEYNDGLASGYGTESAAKERFAPPGQGDCP
jgi:hypothetical protein